MRNRLDKLKVFVRGILGIILDDSGNATLPSVLIQPFLYLGTSLVARLSQHPSRRRVPVKR